MNFKSLTHDLIKGVAIGGIGAGLVLLGYGYLNLELKITEAKKFSSNEEYLQSVEILSSLENSFLVKSFGVKEDYLSDAILEQNNLLSEFTLIEDVGAKKDFSDYEIEDYILRLSTINKDSKYSSEARIKIEFLKRQKLEKALDSEKAARELAEIEARAESIAKQEALSQVVEKEQEEERLSTDKDGDGLSAREEEKLGTSDLNNDTDNDGIIDSKDSNPTGGGRMMPQTFAWNYSGYSWTWTESISEDWYDYYKAKDRKTSGSIGEVHGLQFVTTEDPFIQKVGNVLKTKAEKDGLSKSELALSFVQSLSYVNDGLTGYDEYPKYPIETFFEKNGDCEDSSYLTASLIDSMGIGAALIILPGHMAVGVWMECSTPGSYYKVGDRCYYYAETTSEGYGLGDMPSEYEKVTATVVELGTGKKTQAKPGYETPCSEITDVPGYYTDGQKYYSDKFCTWEDDCIPYEDYFFNGQDFYHDAWCEDVLTAGCYKSDSYPGKYHTTYYWYNDSECTSIYKSKVCSYPYSSSYTCTSDYDLQYYQSLYSSIAASESYNDLISSCVSAIADYESDLNEYNECLAKQE